MTIRTILATMHADVDPTPQLDTAFRLARRLDATVEALHVRPNPAAELAAMAETVAMYRISYGALEQDARKRIARARERYEAWRDTQPDAPQRTVWSEHDGLLEAVLERHGRLADMLVLRHPERDKLETGRAFDAAVFSTGRPCLLVRDHVPSRLLSQVVVAWNGSLEGTHAVAGAMPLLEAAERVAIFSAPRPDGDAGHGPELARALARHGIEAHELPAAGATLLVMGAYTHSRVRQMLLGGVTRHVLDDAQVPVLMAH
jgi:nucleotide-binding universal stress UspA family protein